MSELSNIWQRRLSSPPPGIRRALSRMRVEPSEPMQIAPEPAIVRSSRRERRAAARAARSSR